MAQPSRRIDPDELRRVENSELVIHGFRARIRARSAELQITQRELADRTTLSHTQWVRVLTGRHRLKERHLRELELALGVGPDFWRGEWAPGIPADAQAVSRAIFEEGFHLGMARKK